MQELKPLSALLALFGLIAAAALLGQHLRGNAPPMSDSPYLTKMVQ